MNDKEASRNINSNEYREANLNDDGTYIEGDYQNNSGSRDNVDGNKTVNIYNSHTNQQETVKREKNQQILLNWIKTEVNSRLTQSLHNRISILLDKDEDPLSVSPFWEMELKVDTRKQEKLPSETTIYTVYEREDIKGRLLILGEPGSGKTTTLLQLAKVLVERAKNDVNEPIPMLFNLSAWKEDQQSIHDWIIESLNAPPYGIKREISDQWLQEGIILPLLDGLDELASNRQKLCIDKLNEYLGNERAQLPLIICSRVKEFRHNQTKLFLNGSIILQPLREEQIKDYIERTEGIALWEEIEQDSELLDLCKVPFFLSIIVIACEKISLEKWQSLASLDDKKNYILETYINQMLARPYQEKKYDHNNTKHWLRWLATQLEQESRTEFLIENIQINCLELRQEKIICMLIYGLIYGLIYVLIIGSIFREVFWGLICGLFLGLFYGLFFGKINPIETIELSLVKNKNKLIKEFRGGLICGLFVWLIVGLVDGLIVGLIYGLICGLIGGLLYGLLLGLEGEELDIKTSPNQGIKESGRNAFKLALMASVIIGIVVIPIIHFIVTPITNDLQLKGLSQTLYLTVIAVMLCSVFLAGIPAIQHFCLRIVLTLKNYAPWNYAKFLDYATNRLFLQRVGGGYRFIHRMLQEHFAYGSSESEVR